MSEDSIVEQIILDRLTREQKEFILRMRPLSSVQTITKRDWDNIEPCVEADGEFPDVYWFGGMRKTWPNGHRARHTFQFNEVGLSVRARLALDLTRQWVPPIPQEPTK